MIAPSCSACFIYFICLALLAPVFRSNVFYLGEQEASYPAVGLFPSVTCLPPSCNIGRQHQYVQSPHLALLPVPASSADHSRFRRP